MTEEKSGVHDAIDIIPGRHVLVPIATAESAPEIIDMAFTLMKPDEGQVTVLGNPPTGTEDAASNYAQIVKVVQQYRSDGYPIRLRTKVAGGFTRSILDAVREWGIDVLLLPMYPASEVGGLSARNIAENIVVTTPCSVIMYRPAEAGRINQIIVPVLQETEEPLAEGFRAFLHGRLDKPADLLPYQTAYTQDTNPDEALLAIAVSGRDAWESWQEIAAEDQRILGRSTALLVLFLPAGSVKPLTTWEKAKNWLNPKVAPYEEAELVVLQEESGGLSLDYVVLIVIAAILASLGLIINSNAVIIGAMLVAPLMAPLIAFATGIAVGELRLARKSIIALLVGILLALGISYVAGLISATTIITSEMAGRGNPTFLDLAVALASGVIGAYAAGRKSISSATAGVAIAAALMPPLCTVGLAFAFGEYALSQGAFLLFLTNIISIILAAMITFFWLGLRSYETDEKSKRERRRTSNIFVLLFIAILVALWIRQISSTNTTRIEDVLQESFQQAELVDFDVREEDPLLVVATIRQPIALIDDSSEIIAAKQNLETSLEKEVNLQVVVEPVVDAAAVELRAGLEEDIEQVLTRELPSSILVDFNFVIGNPALVIAAVATDLDENSEAFKNEVQAAESALADVFGVPTELMVVVVGSSAKEVEAIESADLFIKETIGTTLDASLSSSKIERFTYQYGNPTVVEVVVKSDLERDSEAFESEVRTAETALQDALGVPVRLSVEIATE